MKISILIILSLMCSVALFAQDKMYIHKTDKISLGAPIDKTDSIKFDSSGSNVYFNINGTSNPYAVSAIDSISFGDNSNTISVVYSGSSVSITNPLAFEGVSITVSGADVVVIASTDTRDINYRLSGTSTDGMFKIYSEKRFNLYLDGLTLTNADGPAINIQSEIKASIILTSGTTNVLSDGSTYATSTEDQKATLFSEGQLVFSGDGALKVTGVAKNAICSDDNITITGGEIVVASAKKDGVHASDKFEMTAGSLTVTASSDGIECEDGLVLISGGAITTVNTVANVKAITCDSTMTISGGTISMTVSGNQSKGLKAAQNMTFSGGSIRINTSGAAVLSASGSGYDPSYCSAVKCDSSIYLTGASITIVSTGVGGKGISADKNISISSGNVYVSTTGVGATYTNASSVIDAYASCGIEADGNIDILGGTITTISKGSGGKGISSDNNLTIGSSTSSPTLSVTTSGARFLVSGTNTLADYADSKALKSDGILTINSGVITISTSQAGADGIDSDNTLIVNGGTINVTVAGNETKCINANGAMNFAGGNLILKNTGGVNLVSSGSGYDPSYAVGIKSNSNVSFNGASLTIICSGAAARGIKSDANIIVNTGNIVVTNSGAGTTYTNATGTADSYSASCISSDGNISILGGMVTLSASANGGKGISSDGGLTIGELTGASPTINITTSGAKFLVSGTDYCHPKAIVTTGAITINKGTTTISSTDDGIHSEKAITQNGGKVVVSSSVEGIESLVITINDGEIYVTSSNDGFNGTAGLVSGGAETDDGSYIYFKGGLVVTTCTNGDAIDCNGSILMTGGTVIANGPQSGVEESCDYNGTFAVNGGTFVGAGSSSSMTKPMSTSSTQKNLYINASSGVTSSTYLHIQNATGTDILTIKPINGAYKFLFSSSVLATGVSYSLYTGGTYTGGTSTAGYYTGGTYSGGTQNKVSLTTLTITTTTSGMSSITETVNSSATTFTLSTTSTVTSMKF